MSGSIFRRSEVKYVVSDRQRETLLRAMAERMIPDVHGESTVCSVYYDTPDFRLIRTSMEKPVYKEKLRLRSYGPAEPDQPVFMELKKKFKKTVYKRRISVPARTAEAFLRGDAPLPEDCQIGREIEYFRTFYRSLAPAMYLCYDRSAYFARDDADLRVTFDRNILWRTEELTLVSRPGGEPILEAGQSLMEIKAGGAMPLWLARLLSSQGIYKTSFSKYGRAYTAMREGRSAKERSVICA